MLIANSTDTNYFSILVLSPFFSFDHLFIDEIISTALFQYLAFYLAFLLTLLQILSKIILSSSLCSFHILSLNNHANPFTDIFSVVTTKCIILKNLLQTTKITSFPATTNSFIIKSTIKCVYNLFSTLFVISFSANISIWFSIL